MAHNYVYDHVSILILRIKRHVMRSVNNSYITKFTSFNSKMRSVVRQDRFRGCLPVIWDVADVRIPSPVSIVWQIFIAKNIHADTKSNSIHYDYIANKI